MTSRRRANQEIHHERFPAIQSRRLHERHDLRDLPGRVLRLRRHVPVRPELRLRQELIRALP